jgi:putative ABC transport system permease protein
VLGLLAARYGVALLRDAAPQLPRLRDATVDGRIIAFTTGLAALTTVLCSLAPALHATRVDLVRRLAQGGRSVARGRLGAQRILVVVQVTLAVVLLTGAGLVVRSYDRLQRTSPSFSPSNVLAFKISAQWGERPEAVAARQFRTLERLRAIPGVTAAALGSVLPAGATFTPEEIRIVEQPSDEKRFAELRMVSSDYFPRAAGAGTPGAQLPRRSELAPVVGDSREPELLGSLLPGCEPDRPPHRDRERELLVGSRHRRRRL